MEKNESSGSISLDLKLDGIEENLMEASPQDGAGRPPRNAMGIFKALIVKKIKHIPNERELDRRNGKTRI